MLCTYRLFERDSITTSEIASNAMNNTNKGVKIEVPTLTHDSPSTLHVSPNQTSKDCDLSSARIFAVTLRRHLSPIVKRIAESHIDLLHKQITKMNQSNKMDTDSNLIPRFTRLVNFDFRVTKLVKNSQSFWLLRWIQKPSC